MNTYRKLPIFTVLWLPKDESSYTCPQQEVCLVPETMRLSTCLSLNTLSFIPKNSFDEHFPNVYMRL